MDQIIVFGGGRMGLSHAAMAGLLKPNLDILVVEPNLQTRIFLKMIVGRGVRVVGKAKRLDFQRSTHAVIATPPKVHESNLRQLIDAGFAGRVLIEKPLMVSPSYFAHFGGVMSGYVLRHAYFWKSLKKTVSGETVKSVIVRLETNQDFAAEDSGWRMDKSVAGLSLLSEFGSHCINLLLDVTSTDDMSVASHEMNKVTLMAPGEVPLRIELVSNSPRVRKSVYMVEVEAEAGVYRTDFYSFSRSSGCGSNVSSTSLAEEGVRAPAYLRGQEFSEQMAKFLDDAPLELKDIDDAVATDELLEKLRKELKCQN